MSAEQENQSSGWENKRALQNLWDELQGLPSDEHEQPPDEVPTRVGHSSGTGVWPDFPDYEILSELGRGGMGVVYKARQKSLDRIVALKVIKAGLKASPEDVQRFHREAEVVAKLGKCHNIVQIFEVGEQHGWHYFSMEYVEGGSLAGKTPYETGDPKKVASLMAKIARAIAYGHQHHILHRDLKPANILLDGDDEPLVSDFGLSKRFVVDDTPATDAQAREGGSCHTGPEAGGGLTRAGFILGTPWYMAPEQADRKPLGPAVDVFGLGAILYELLTGRQPYCGKTYVDALLQASEGKPRQPREVNPNVELNLERICLKCLAKEPSDRYASAARLADDLERFCEDDPWLEAHPIEGLYDLLHRSYRTKWWRVKLAASALVFALVLLVVGSLAVTYAMVRWYETVNENTREAEKRLSRLSDELKLRDATAKRSQRITMVHAYETLGHTRPPLCPPLSDRNRPGDPNTVALAACLDEGNRALALAPPDWGTAQKSYRKALTIAEEQQAHRIWGTKPKQTNSSGGIFVWDGDKDQKEAVETRNELLAVLAEGGIASQDGQNAARGVFFLLLQLGDGAWNARQPGKARRFYQAAVQYGTEFLANKDKTVYPYLIARYGQLAWLNWPSRDDVGPNKYPIVVDWLKLSVTVLDHIQEEGKGPERTVWQMPQTLRSNSQSKINQSETDNSSTTGSANPTAGQPIERGTWNNLWSLVKTVFFWISGLGLLLGLSRRGWEAMMRAMADFIRGVSFPQLPATRDGRKEGA